MAAVNSKADALQVLLATGDAAADLPVIGTIDGVIVKGASHTCGPGKGVLRSERDGRTLSWRAPGSTRFGPPVDTYADGQYLLEDGESPAKYLHVDVRTSYLQPRPTESPVYIQEYWNLGIKNISAAEAAGYDETVSTAFYLKNLSQSVLTNIRAWVDPASTYWEIRGQAPDPWVKPTTEEAALALGDLAPGAQRTFLQRHRHSGPIAAVARQPAIVHFRFDGP